MRHYLRDLLRDLSSESAKLLLVMRDFNEIMYSHEKARGKVDG